MNEKFTAKEVCENLGITIWTLTNWYQWERISLTDGSLTDRVLPIAKREETEKGRPRYWSREQLAELQQFQKTVVRGRNGKMAKVTNPKSRQAKH